MSTVAVEPPEVLSVGQLYRKSKNAIAREFRGPVWVSGEIKSIRDHRGSWYIQLIEPGDFADGTDISLDVACWTKRKLVIEAQLSQAGIKLAAGLEVRICGTVTLGKFGKVMVELTALDTEALLGRQLAEKRLLFEALVKEGLVNKNRELPLTSVPLRVGLVTSEGSDGFNDFMGELQRSGHNYAVSLVHSPVQGPTAAALLARAIQSFTGGSVDVIAVVRGGGGELDAFDKEPVVRAIANSSTPVWAGIGHTADRSLTDEIVNQSFITPTACAQAIVARVNTYMARVDNVRRHLERTVAAQLDRSEASLRRQADQVRRCSDRDLALAAAGLQTLRRDLGRGLRNVPEQSHLQLLQTIQRLRLATDLRLDRWTHDNEVRRLTVAQFDPVLAVKRGYSLTYNGQGVLVRSAAELGDGDLVTSKFADGDVSSTVSAVNLHA